MQTNTLLFQFHGDTVKRRSTRRRQTVIRAVDWLLPRSLQEFDIPPVNFTFVATFMNSAPNFWKRPLLQTPAPQLSQLWDEKHNENHTVLPWRVIFLIAKRSQSIFPFKRRRHNSLFEPKNSFPARHVSSGAVNLFRETLIKPQLRAEDHICNYNLKTSGPFWTEPSLKTTRRVSCCPLIFLRKVIVTRRLSDGGKVFFFFFPPNREENFFFFFHNGDCGREGFKTLCDVFL